MPERWPRRPISAWWLPEADRGTDRPPRVDSGAVPSLRAREGPLAGQRLTVESALTLGRGSADVVIDDPEISRRHALVRACEGYFEIEDLDSLNGTWVNDVRISESVRVRPGDVVRLGSTVLEVEADLEELPP